MDEQSENKHGRREFLGAAATAGFMIVKPQWVRGTTANSQIRFGILGCGDRGTTVGTGFVQNAGARVMAMGDLFGDQLEAGRNFNVVFTYPGDVQISFGSTQFDHPTLDACVKLFGTDGVSEAHYDSRVNIVGKNNWDAGLRAPKEGEHFPVGGSFKGALDQADPEKQKAFVASITSGAFFNQADLGAESAMSAMLGRTAAYTERPITWEELQESREVFDPKIDISKFGA